MSANRSVLVSAACAVVLTTLPNAAKAQSSADLERRVAELEAALASMRAELDASRRPSAAIGPVASAPDVITTASSARPATPAEPPRAPDGFRVGATTVQISGFIKADVLASRYSDGDTAVIPVGRDFYLPASIPVGGTSTDNQDFDGHTKQTRLSLSTSTPIGTAAVTTLVEGDFQTSPGPQGTERTTNGYNFALRRAFITYGDWTIGQDWSNFAHIPLMPETTDLIGPVEGAIFVRQPQVRWRQRFGERTTLSLALENAETASTTPISSVLNENDDDELPDVTAKLVYAGSFGELSLAAVGRRLSVDAPGVEATATGWGVSLGGKIPFGEAKRNDVRFQVATGEGIGRYLGVNFASDAVFVTRPADPELETLGVTAAFASARWFWTDRWRSTFMISGQRADVLTGLTAPDANREAWSAAANLFYSPIRGLDFGAEYRHGERETANGFRGSLDRIHFIAKQAF